MHLINNIVWHTFWRIHDIQYSEILASRQRSSVCPKQRPPRPDDDLTSSVSDRPNLFGSLVARTASRAWDLRSILTELYLLTVITSSKLFFTKKSFCELELIVYN